MGSGDATPQVATESGFNAVPAIVHLIGIALGLFLGLQVMGAIAPDLPSDEVEPGVSSSVVPEAVAGGDPDSLFDAANLAPALTQLDDQLGAGDGLVRLRITPGGLESTSIGGDGLFQAADVSPGTPAAIVAAIHAERAQVTLDDIAYMELVATRDGPTWYVQLDSATTDVSPPWTYGAPLAGTPVSPGGAPPVAVDEPAPDG